MDRYILTQGLLYWYFFIKNNHIKDYDTISDIHRELDIIRRYIENNLPLREVRELDQEFQLYLAKFHNGRWRTFVKYVEDTIGLRL